MESSDSLKFSTAFAAANLIHSSPTSSVSAEDLCAGSRASHKVDFADNSSTCSRNSSTTSDPVYRKNSSCEKPGAVEKSRSVTKVPLKRSHHTMCNTSAPSEPNICKHASVDNQSPVSQYSTNTDSKFFTATKYHHAGGQHHEPWRANEDHRATMAAFSLAYSSLLQSQPINCVLRQTGVESVQHQTSSSPSHGRPSCSPSASNCTPSYMNECIQGMIENKSPSFAQVVNRQTNSTFQNLLSTLFSNDHGAWQQIQAMAHSQHVDPRILGLYNNTGCPFEIPGTGRRKNATRETTSMLKAWLNEHRKNPYPTKGEKIMLAIVTKMSLTQVSTWFANARRRLKKENKMTWSARSSGVVPDRNDDSVDEDCFEEDDCQDVDQASRIPQHDDMGKFLLPPVMQRCAAMVHSGQHVRMDHNSQSNPSHKNSTKRISHDDIPEACTKQRRIWSVAEFSQDHNATSRLNGAQESDTSKLCTIWSEPQEHRHKILDLNLALNSPFRTTPIESTEGVGLPFNMMNKALGSDTGFEHTRNSLLSPAALAAFYLYCQQQQRQVSATSAGEILTNGHAGNSNSLHSRTLSRR